MPGLGGPSCHESAVERTEKFTLANYAVETRPGPVKADRNQEAGFNNVCLADIALKNFQIVIFSLYKYLFIIVIHA